MDGDERKRRWFGDSEFIYSLDATKGHLPLTRSVSCAPTLPSLCRPVLALRGYERRLSRSLNPRKLTLFLPCHLHSALRGTQLLTEIFAHPLWDEEEWAEKDKKSKK